MMDELQIAQAKRQAERELRAQGLSRSEAKRRVAAMGRANAASVARPGFLQRIVSRVLP